jgi:N-methylhydantoinase A
MATIAPRSAPADAGAGVGGPSVIELPTTTILLLDKQAALVDDHGNFLVETV